MAPALKRGFETVHALDKKGNDWPRRIDGETMGARNNIPLEEREVFLSTRLAWLSLNAPRKVRSCSWKRNLLLSANEMLSRCRSPVILAAVVIVGPESDDVYIVV